MQTGIAASLLALVAVCAATLWWILRQSAVKAANSGKSARPAVALCLALCVALAGGLSFFALERYFDTDQQFGPPGNGLSRILDRVTSEAREGDGIVTLTPYHYHVLMNRYKGKLPVYGFSEMSPLPAQASDILQRMTRQHGRLWLITAGISPGSPQNGIERWLSEQAFKASDEWYDDFRLCLFGTGAPSDNPASSENSTFGESIRLNSYRLGPLHQHPGGLLDLALTWEARAKVSADYSVFVHLVSKDGRLVAQQDGAPVGGFSPTSTWSAGNTVQDRHALLLPGDVGPGQYEVWLGLYNPATGERVPVRLADGTSADHVVLTDIEVAR